MEKNKCIPIIKEESVVIYLFLSFFILDLLNQASAEATYDPVTQGIQLNWVFSDALSGTLSEISTANLRWFTQRRTGTAKGWDWTPLVSFLGGGHFGRGIF